MGNGDDPDHVGLKLVDQGIRETVERQGPRVARARVAQLGEPLEEAERSIELVGEIGCGDERTFADVPIDGRIGIGLRLVAKTDQHWLWQH